MSKTISIHERRERIKHLGEQLSFRELTTEDKEFLSEALIQIGNGADAAIALDVNARRGESKSEQARQVRERKEFIKIMFKALREKGESVESIVTRLGENDLHLFGLTEETLRTYYQDKP
jgi:hypothetical protein